MNERHEVASGLLVARRNPSIVLDPTHESFDQISLLVLVFAVLSLLKSIAARRNHGLSAPTFDVLDQGVCVVALVGNHSSRLVIGQQFGCSRDVVFLSWPQAQLDRLPLSIYGNVQFAAEAAARTAKTLFGRFFFSGEPAAC